MDSGKYDELIKQVAPGSFELFKAQLIRESGLDPTATGSSGEQGIAQILPSTWDEIKSITGLTGSAYDPGKAIPGAGSYMRSLLKRYSYIADEEDRYNTALAAYNAGMGRVDKAISVYASNSSGSTKIEYDDFDDLLPDSTQNYVKEINSLSKRMDTGTFGDAQWDFTKSVDKLLTGAKETVNNAMDFSGIVSQFFQRPILIPIYAGVTIFTIYAGFTAIKKYKDVGLSKTLGSSFKSGGKLLKSGFKTLEGIVK